MMFSSQLLVPMATEFSVPCTPFSLLVSPSATARPAPDMPSLFCLAGSSPPTDPASAASTGAIFVSLVIPDLGEEYGCSSCLTDPPLQKTDPQDVPGTLCRCGWTPAGPQLGPTTGVAWLPRTKSAGGPSGAAVALGSDWAKVFSPTCFTEKNTRGGGKVCCLPACEDGRIHPSWFVQARSLPKM